MKQKMFFIIIGLLVVVGGAAIYIVRNLNRSSDLESILSTTPLDRNASTFDAGWNEEGPMTTLKGSVVLTKGNQVVVAEGHMTYLSVIIDPQFMREWLTKNNLTAESIDGKKIEAEGTIVVHHCGDGQCTTDGQIVYLRDVKGVVIHEN